LESVFVKMDEAKIQGLDNYWTLVGAELICSVKRLYRYMEMDPSQDWTKFGYVGWEDTRYSKAELLAFVQSPNFQTIFQHYLNQSDAVLKEAAECKERDAKRRKIENEEQETKRREENVRLSQLTPDERKQELERMKVPDLKNVYKRLSGGGTKAAIIDRIIEHETQNNKLKV